MAFALALFSRSWRCWLDPSEYAQAGWTAMAEGATTAFANTYMRWMIRGILRSLRAASLQRPRLIHGSRKRIRA